MANFLELLKSSIPQSILNRYTSQDKHDAIRHVSILESFGVSSDRDLTGDAKEKYRIRLDEAFSFAKWYKGSKLSDVWVQPVSDILLDVQKDGVSKPVLIKSVEIDGNVNTFPKGGKMIVTREDDKVYHITHDGSKFKFSKKLNEATENKDSSLKVGNSYDLDVMGNGKSISSVYKGMKNGKHVFETNDPVFKELVITYTPQEISKFIK